MGASSTWSVLKANPILMLYAAGSILSAFVYNQHTFALPIFLKDALGTVAGPRAYGIVMMTNGLTVVALTALVVLASRRLRSLSAVALSSAFYAVGFGSYWLWVVCMWRCWPRWSGPSGRSWAARTATPS